MRCVASLRDADPPRNEVPGHQVQEHRRASHPGHQPGPDTGRAHITSAAEGGERTTSCTRQLRKSVEYPAIIVNSPFLLTKRPFRPVSRKSGRVSGKVSHKNRGFDPKDGTSRHISPVGRPTIRRGSSPREVHGHRIVDHFGLHLLLSSTTGSASCGVSTGEILAEPCRMFPDDLTAGKCCKQRR